MSAAPSSPDFTPLQSRRSSNPRRPLSLDLSSLPPLVQPTPPSNTLLITNLLDLEIFSAPNLQTIRESINASAVVHSFAPLKSFRRIVVSFFSKDAAVSIKNILDGEMIMGNIVKVYFGQPTSIEARDRHLPLPDAGKLFFISPPPSPPHGWEVKLEGAPNKQVHAEDLAEALAKLHHRPQTELPASPLSDVGGLGRARSASTTIYNPSEHGNSPNLPAVTVEDCDDCISPLSVERPIFAHTSRPPVELM